MLSTDESCEFRALFRSESLISAKSMESGLTGNELSRIVEFIRAGGMEISRAKEKTALEEERRKLHEEKLAFDMQTLAISRFRFRSGFRHCIYKWSAETVAGVNVRCQSF
jgi:hypothetical protein